MLSLLTRKKLTTKKQRRVRERIRNRLGGEPLEARAMLAGDVDVVVSNGDLRIYGDASNNTLEVRGLEDRGIEIRGTTGTLLNGQTEPLIVYPDAVGIPDDLYVNLGRGSNEISITGVIAGDDIKVDGGRGDDTIRLEQVVANDLISIRPGSGNDRVNVIGKVGGDEMTARDIQVYATGGNNVIAANNVRVIRDVYLRTANGNDVVLAEGVEAGDDLSLYSAQGDDTVAILDSIIADRTTLKTGSAGKYRFFGHRNSDQDSAPISNSAHGDLADIDLGSGDDFIGVSEARIGARVKLAAGSGDDEVGVRSSLFDEEVYLDGGRGTDGLSAVDNGFELDPNIRSFETEVLDLDGKIEAILQILADSGRPATGTGFDCRHCCRGR